MLCASQREPLFHNGDQYHLFVMNIIRSRHPHSEDVSLVQQPHSAPLLSVQYLPSVSTPPAEHLRSADIPLGQTNIATWLVVHLR